MIFLRAFAITAMAVSIDILAWCFFASLLKTLKARGRSRRLQSQRQQSLLIE